VEETRYLAIDFGEKRIGTAITDPLKILAQPFIVVENNHKTMERFSKIVKEKHIEKIILGMPCRDDGTETVVMKKIEVFGKALEKQFAIPVIIVDERYSSSIASQRIVAGVPKKMKRRDKSLIDIQAAVVLLEDYLRAC
jgi:putative Holliday junction resolvase